MMKFIGGYVLLLVVTACGSSPSPDSEETTVGSDYNMDVSNLFICQAVISTGNRATDFASLELDAPLKIVYSVLFGTNTANNEKIVSAEIDTRYNEAGTSFDSSDFDVSKTSYYFDIGTSSPLTMAHDLNENNDGIWSFSNVAGQPTAVYTDPDLTASPVTITFAIEGDDTECSGGFAAS